MLYVTANYANRLVLCIVDPHIAVVWWTQLVMPQIRPRYDWVVLPWLYATVVTCAGRSDGTDACVLHRTYRMGFVHFCTPG